MPTSEDSLFVPKKEEDGGGLPCKVSKALSIFSAAGYPLINYVCLSLCLYKINRSTAEGVTESQDEADAPNAFACVSFLLTSYLWCREEQGLPIFTEVCLQSLGLSKHGAGA